MTPTITLPRATAQQALEAMRRAVPTGKITLYEWAKALSDLDAALAQQAEPVAAERERCAEYLMQQAAECREDSPTRVTLESCAAVLRLGLVEWVAQQAEPVAWAFRHSDGTYHDPSVTEHSAGMVPLYPPPPQRKPLTEQEIERICAPLGFAQLSPVEVARAIERAHNITDPQIEDRLARHGIPMPGDPK